METAVPTLTAYLAEPLEVGAPDIAGPLAVFPLFGPPAEVRETRSGGNCRPTSTAFGSGAR